MSPVEWIFGKVVTKFDFFRFKKNQKLLLRDVGVMYNVGLLQTNWHSCLYGSQRIRSSIKIQFLWKDTSCEIYFYDCNIRKLADNDYCILIFSVHNKIYIIKKYKRNWFINVIFSTTDWNICNIISRCSRLARSHHFFLLLAAAVLIPAPLLQFNFFQI